MGVDVFLLALSPFPFVVFFFSGGGGGGGVVLL